MYNSIQVTIFAFHSFNPFKISSNFDLSIYSVYLQSLLVHITRTRTHPSLRVYVSMRAGEAHWSHTTAFSDILSSIYIHPYAHIRTCAQDYSNCMAGGFKRYSLTCLILSERFCATRNRLQCQQSNPLTSPVLWSWSTWI